MAAIIALNETCGLPAPTTRTALSRMVAQGWLQRRADDGGLRGYCATEAARERMTRTRERVYADGPVPWDGRWHVVVVDSPHPRRVRHRVSAAIQFLGYGRLAQDTWLSPRPSEEVSAALAGLGVTYTSVHGPCPRAPAELAAEVWDLVAVGSAYQAFADSLPDPGTMVLAEPAAAYARRTELVHRWRTFLFLDPALPAEALPHAWPGHTARERFLACAAALAPATQAHVDRVLCETGGSPLIREPTVVPS